ncbi:hypothetical protein [Pedobacter sp. R-06]|uniref:hypothetical protein n=1 Tax=Pedobacter sp. R-06 TaxID=3404051 RepID=UPI003CEA4024
MTKLKRNESGKQKAQGNLRVSGDKKLISIHNTPLKDLTNQLENLLGSNVLPEFDSNKGYDMTLSLENFKDIKKSLNYYGLSISKEKRTFKRFLLEK